MEIASRAKDYYLGSKGYKHRGCSLAIAEAFNFYTPLYHSLRRGGLTGEYRCGAITTAELILGEIFGPVQSEENVDDRFMKIILYFRKCCRGKIFKGKIKSDICHNLVKGFKDFNSLSRFYFCGELVKKTAEALEETIEKFGGKLRNYEISKRNNPLAGTD
ncbi:MAG: hypothetical protein COY66_03875 [Candidatus Kerfeldbacteria bacterium CG_4_10_14_0_8_um_filter_42_10]|uniref:C_GCAxxG_C_C family protein n=1 Tax=Candidatus Kerfeldbacteria bacterium CG_4_10_14_0_8_um_filter_42_10 TaxID=2014248 RepID=A0A2M7RJC5_9BACT|nr:MAG: hypothetical protein COY66_03875 [Candidatus Kerfeldbacteria bacterium CG_4_10_14_0_8_um_filter_42_10]